MDLYLKSNRDPFHEPKLSQIMARINNYNHGFLEDVITQQSYNLTGGST